MANEVLLQEGQVPLSKDLRPLKVGGESSSLEISQWGSGAKINGDLLVTGTMRGKTDILLIDDITCDDIVCDTLTVGADITSTGLTITNSGDFEVDSSEDISLSADGTDGYINFKKSGTILGYVLGSTSSTFHLLSTSNYHMKLETQGNADMLLVASDDLTITVADEFTIDKDVTSTDAGTYKGLTIDVDKTGTSTTTNSIYGLDIDMDNTTATDGINSMFGISVNTTLSHAADAGTVFNRGIAIDVNGNAYGNSVGVGLSIDVANHDTNNGILITSADGYHLRCQGTTNDYFTLSCGTNGLTILSTTDTAATAAHMYLQPDGNLNLEAAGHVEFDGCAVGFDLETPTYDATDTDVSFITGNKQFVTFDGGNITDLNLIFPETSGNFVLLLKQDGTGSRTVTNYKAWDLANDDAADGSATVKFAGGSNPDLTDDANHVDIISIFYDADNEIAYGVASLDFQF